MTEVGSGPHEAASEDELDVYDLGGETAGEQEVASNTSFFVSKKAAAVLKHAVLKQYVIPFASKVGSTALDKRVVYVDGYAGPGRYADGTDGSPVLVLDDARRIAGYRNLYCVFVEKRRSDFKLLEKVIAEARAEGIECSAYPGRLQKRLYDVLAEADGQPMFCFIDPFGLGLPFDDLVSRVLTGARPIDGPPTEVLLNFSANAVRRIGGLLRSEPKDARINNTLSAMDSACGGDWWREVFLSARDNEEAVDRIVHDFMRRVCESTRYSGWTVDVRNRAHLQPVYYLVFFTRHRDGIFLFGEAISLAQAEWRRACAPPPDEDEQPGLWSFDDEEKAREQQWIEIIKGNIQRLLNEGGTFVVRGKYVDVFGSTLGLARSRHVRSAVKALHKEGVTSCDGKGEVGKLKIIPVSDAK